ncbi:MAG: hypothetical protein ACYSWU_00340 [Planctomycetota bacterium]|jgi:hypothetical protein
MRGTNVRSKSLLLAAVFVGLVSVPSLSAGAESWKEETVLISPQGDQTTVRSLKGDKVLFQNADPQLAMEWGLANARATLVLAGKYVVSDSVDIPRDDVTLIIDQGAEISLNPRTEHKTDIGFRPAGSWQLVPLIYNHGRDNVRVIHLGTLVHSVWQDRKPAKQTFPVVFDGRNEQRTCGVEGGLLLVAGSAAQSFLLLDARGVHVPLLTPDSDSRMDGVLTLEGCEGCRLGMIVNLAPEPGGKTGETVDLNSSNRSITIERLVGERSQEIIDMNGSHADVKEIVSVGKPQKLLCFCVGSGPRWTSRPRAADRLDVWQAAVLEDAADVRRRIEVPKLPDALPRFTVKATVEVTLKDGSKKEYTKEVEVDVRYSDVRAENRR